MSKVKMVNNFQRLNQRGGILATTALMAVPLIGVAVLSADLGLAFLERTEMTNAADLAALAAIKQFARHSNITDANNRLMIRTAASLTALQNQTRHNQTGINLSTANDTDITFGLYNPNATTNKFTAYSDASLASQPVNAIRITVRLDDTQNTSFTFKLAQFLTTCGLPPVITLEAQAIASFGIMNIVTVLDISGSMRYLTYRPSETCPYPFNGPGGQDLWANNTRYFSVAGTTQTTPQHCYILSETCKAATKVNHIPYINTEASCETEIPVFGPVDTTYAAVMPQPMTDIFETTRDVLLQNDLFTAGSMYRAGLVVYNTTAYEPYTTGTSVALSPTRMGNKADLEFVLTESIQRWQTFANLASANPAPPWTELTRDRRDDYIDSLHSRTAFPGGLRPPLTSYTNIGDAIYKATSWITTTNAASTQTRLKDMIILLSDGEPNCWRWPSPTTSPPNAWWGVPPLCKIKMEDSDYTVKGKQWAVKNAEFAAQNHIILHAVFFNTDQEGTCGGATQPPGFLHLQDVAEAANGNAYCANDISQLSQIFEDLSEERAFVLVPLT